MKWWSSSDDLLLIQAVHEHGERWREIKKSLGYIASEDAIRNRYKRLTQLPTPKPFKGVRSAREPWTKCEDLILIKQVMLQKHSHRIKWSQIVAQHLPRRTSQSARNRYERILDKYVFG